MNLEYNKGRSQSDQAVGGLDIFDSEGAHDPVRASQNEKLLAGSFPNSTMPSRSPA